MADNRGGYQRPRNPAPVSGPGALSRRTDGGPGETPKQAAQYLSGQNYGDSKELNELATSAPLAAAGPMVVALDAPTQRPNEPVTAGVDVGPGPGPEVLGGPRRDRTADLLRAAYDRYPSAHLRVMVQRLEAMGR